MPDFGLGALIRGIREGSLRRLERARPVPPAAQVIPSPPAAVAPEVVPAEVVPPEIAAVELQQRGREAPPLAGLDEAAIASEADRFTKLNLGRYDLGASWQPNFDMIVGDDDIRAVIADAAARNKARIEIARGGVQTHEDLLALSQDMGVESRALEAALRRETGGDLPAPAVVLSMRQVVNKSAGILHELAKKITEHVATDMDKIRFRRQITLHDRILTGFMGVRAEYGRGLGVFGIPLDVSTNPVARQRLAEMLNNLDAVPLESIARQFAELDSTNAVSKVARRHARSRVGGVIRDLAYGSALSSPVTHEINFFSGPLFWSANMFERAVAARVGSVIPGMGAIEKGEAAAQFFGMMTGVHQAFREAGKAAKAGAPVAGLRTRRGEAQLDRGISAQNLFKTGTSGSNYVDKAINLIGSVIRFWPERVMIPSDEFIKSVTRNMEAARLGYLDAMSKARAKDMTPEEFANAIREYMDNPDTAAVEEAAMQATYQNAMPPRIRQLASAIRAFPGGFLVAMFVQTPTNLFVQGLGKRSPLALVTQSFWRDVAAGGARRDLALTRFTIGSLTSAMIAMLALGDNITGYGPHDPKKRAIWLLNHAPYSFRYFNPFEGEYRWQSYARFEPLAYVIGATADAVQIGKEIGYVEGEQEDSPMNESVNKLNNITGMIVGAVMENTLNKVFMKGVADLVNAASDPGRYMANYLTGIGRLLVPWASFRGWVNRVQDPLIRQSWDAIDKLRNTSGIPGLSRESPPKRDIFAAPLEWPKGEIFGQLSFAPGKQAPDDPVADELEAVMNNTGRAPITMPGQRIEGMKLTMEEYDELVVQARAEPDPETGRTFREAIEELIESPTYQDATYDERLVLLRAVKDQYDSRVRGGGESRPGALELDDPEFADRLLDFRLRKQESLEGL